MSRLKQPYRQTIHFCKTLKKQRKLETAATALKLQTHVLHCTRSLYKVKQQAEEILAKKEEHTDGSAGQTLF